MGNVCRAHEMPNNIRHWIQKSSMFNSICNYIGYRFECLSDIYVYIYLNLYVETLRNRTNP